MFSSSYSISDTICAISTPMGRSGIGVVRMSGHAAVKIADSVFKSKNKKPLSKTKSHTLRHGWIEEKGQIVDEVLVSVLKKPNTYTGEDTIEFSMHGGPVLLNRLLMLLIKRGARNAKPGEFTFRAFINSKLDLSMAEAVSDIIESKTELSAKAGINQLKGRLSETIYKWKENLMGLISHLEVSIDYPEEDISLISKKDIKQSLKNLSLQMDKLIKTSDKGRMLREGLRASIIGKPNSGKSSLLNALIERDRAIVSDIPGTTRDSIEENLDIEGIPLLITDTAGLRNKTRDPIEKMGQDKAIEFIKTSDIILLVIDLSKKLGTEDDFILNILLPYKNKVIPVLNKSDVKPKLTPFEIKSLKLQNKPVHISCLKRTGLDVLEDAVKKLIYSNFNSFGKDTISVNARHKQALIPAKDEIELAEKAIESGFSEEIIAFHLRNSLNYLGEITGETATEDILENIFSKFCVGK